MSKKETWCKVSGVVSYAYYKGRRVYGICSKSGVGSGEVTPCRAHGNFKCVHRTKEKPTGE